MADKQAETTVLASDVYPAGVPCWIDSAQPEPERAAGFYAELFGWDFTPTDGYFVARLDGHEVAALTSGPRPGWTTYVCVDDAALAAKRAVEAGGEVVAEPAATAAGGRVALLADPSGAVFGVWEPDGRRGAQLVNAPGTWNFSNLTTPDVDGATAFYGEVFGWEARGPLWCLPGYGQTQDAKEPGFLRRHAEAGTPEGFTDCFGWLAPAPTGQPAAWDVTFAVGDVAAVAARAVYLGGTVVVAPYDAGQAQVAVLADPWGATFTVSAYTPD
jgi:predicted enzyme related to lactoylglutathione lyase